MESKDLEIAIVGAGMSGLLMGIRLKEAGFDRFRIYEKAQSVGGTWRENTYPGLSCDVPSFLYSYSFEPKLDWTQRFSPGPEILGYFEGIARKYDLLSHIEFGAEIDEARYAKPPEQQSQQSGQNGPDGGSWRIRVKGRGDAVRADVLILASGPLHQKKYPEIDGLESFAGACFHSADWDHSVALEGKRIGVVGTGSTAIQMMEPLSEVASHLTMFQRTAQWVMPVGNKEYSSAKQRFTQRFPWLAKLTRAWYKRMFEFFSVAVVEEGFGRREIARRCRKHLAQIVDPELRRKLTPDYEPGCKRLVMSTSFYPTLEKEHVDLEAEGIERIEPRGVVTKGGVLHELDVLVLATGFDAHDWGVDSVVGEKGQSLIEAWADGTRSYRSLAMPGFPNFFMLVGPNSPIGNLSIIDVSETQSAYIVRCLERLQQRGLDSLQPNETATRAFHETLLEAMNDTIWVTGCNSWYLDEEGVPITWPWSAQRFHDEMKTPRFGDWDEQAA